MISMLTGSWLTTPKMKKCNLNSFEDFVRT